MRLTNGLRTALFFFSISILIGIAQAAEIRFLPTWDLVLLEGKIEKGDYDKVLKIAKAILVRGIYLASPGGDVAEAMRIGRLIRRLRWETEIPQAQALSDRPDLIKNLARVHGLKDPIHNNLCASACFFIHIAGIYRFGDTLLIHRPYLSEAELRKVSGDQVLRISQVARAETDAYLKEMGLPAKYSETMYSVPKDQVQLLAESDIKADIYGFIPELQDWVNTRCEKTTIADRVAKNYLMTKPSEKWTAEEKQMVDLAIKRDIERINCWKDVMEQLRVDAFKREFAGVAR